MLQFKKENHYSYVFIIICYVIIELWYYTQTTCVSCINTILCNKTILLCEPHTYRKSQSKQKKLIISNMFTLTHGEKKQGKFKKV